MKYINNKEVAKYEGKDYFIFFDREMKQYGVWVFVDVHVGHMETFSNKNEAFDYLQQYHFQYLKDREILNSDDIGVNK